MGIHILFRMWCACVVLQMYVGCLGMLVIYDDCYVMAFVVFPLFWWQYTFMEPSHSCIPI